MIKARIRSRSLNAYAGPFSVRLRHARGSYASARATEFVFRGAMTRARNLYRVTYIHMCMYACTFAEKSVTLRLFWPRVTLFRKTNIFTGYEILIGIKFVLERSLYSFKMKI